MVAHTDDELIFTPDGNRMGIAVTDKGKISVNVLKDVTKIFHTREETFVDLNEALKYLRDLTGQRPLFGIDERTANTKAG